MTRALILDFGGVISRTLFETHAQTEAVLELPPGTLTWRGPFDPDGDPLWREQQAGRISERDYWLHRARETGLLVGQKWDSMQQLVQGARAAQPDLVIRPQARAAIAQARQHGCKLAVLSNELDLFYGAQFRARLSLLADFDVIADATYTGILKPDPRAYLDCVARLGLSVTDCVFVDDQPANVKGARDVNLQTVWFNVREPAASFALALQALLQN